MSYFVDMSPLLGRLSQALTFEVSPMTQIELEGLIIELTDGAPEGMLRFDVNGFTMHPILLLGSLPAFSDGLGRLCGVDAESLSNPLAWADAGLPSVAAVFTDLASEASRKLIEWSSCVLTRDGYCPLEVLERAIETGHTFDQVKTQMAYLRSGLRRVITC